MSQHSTIDSSSHPGPTMLWNPDKIFNNLHFHLSSLEDEHNALFQLFDSIQLSQEFRQALEEHATRPDREDAISQIYLWLDKQQRSGTIKRSIIDIWRHLLPILEESQESIAPEDQHFESMDALLVSFPQPSLLPPPVTTGTSSYAAMPEPEPESEPTPSLHIEAETKDRLKALYETNSDKILFPLDEAQAKIISDLVYEPEPLTPVDNTARRPSFPSPNGTAQPTASYAPFAEAQNSHTYEDHIQAPREDKESPTQPTEMFAPRAPHKAPAQAPTSRQLQILAGLLPSKEQLPAAQAQSETSAASNALLQPLPFVPIPTHSRKAQSTKEHPALHTKERPGPRKRIYQTGNYPRIEKIDPTGNYPQIQQPHPKHIDKQDGWLDSPQTRTPPEQATPLPTISSLPASQPSGRLTATPSSAPPPAVMVTKPRKPLRKTSVHKTGQYPKQERIDAPAGGRHPLHALRKRRAQTNPHMDVLPPDHAQATSTHKPHTLHSRTTSSQASPSRDRLPQASQSQDRLSQARPSQNRPSQASQSQPRLPQAGPSHKRPSQATPSQDRLNQAHSSQNRPSQASQSQGRLPQASPSQGRLPQARASRDRLSQARASQGERSQVRPSHLSPSQDRLEQPSTAQIRRSGMSPSQTQLPPHTLAPQEPKSTPTQPDNGHLDIHHSNPKPRVKAGMSPQEHRNASGHEQLDTSPSTGRPGIAQHLHELTRASIANQIPPHTAGPKPIQSNEQVPTQAPSLNVAPHSLSFTPPPRLPSTSAHVSKASQPPQPKHHIAHNQREYQALTDNPVVYAETIDAFELQPEAQSPAPSPTSDLSSDLGQAETAAHAVFEIPSDEFASLDSQAALDEILHTESPPPDGIDNATPSEDELIFDEEVVELDLSQWAETTASYRLTPTQPSISPIQEEATPTEVKQTPSQVEHTPLEDALPEPEWLELSEPELPDVELPDLELLEVEAPTQVTSTPLSPAPSSAAVPLDTLLEQLDNAPDFQAFDSREIDAVESQEAIALDISGSDRDVYGVPYPAMAELSSPRPRIWLVVLLTTLIVSTLLVGGTYLARRWLLPGAIPSDAKERDPFPWQRAQLPIQQVWQDKQIVILVMQKRWRQHTSLQPALQRISTTLETIEKQGTWRTSSRTKIRKVRLVDQQGKHIHWLLRDALRPPGDRRVIKRPID